MPFRHLIPFVLFVVVAAALGVGLTLKPKEIPTALIDQPIPEFELPPLEGKNNGLASNDLRNGNVQVVNVFASWCLPCKAEHPFLMELSKSGKARLSGINYKDKPENVAKWLDDLGDPFALIGADREGRTSIDWGVYGVPETFIVDGAGRIRMKYLGPLNNVERTTVFFECLEIISVGDGQC